MQTYSSPIHVLQIFHILQPVAEGSVQFSGARGPRAWRAEEVVVAEAEVVVDVAEENRGTMQEGLLKEAGVEDEEKTDEVEGEAMKLAAVEAAVAVPTAATLGSCVKTLIFFFSAILYLIFLYKLAARAQLALW
jgi:hypothetical protein